MGHTTSIEHVAAALAQGRNVGRGAGGWYFRSRKTVAPEMGTLIVAVDFRTQIHRFEPGSGVMVRSGAAKVYKGYEQQF